MINAWTWVKEEKLQSNYNNKLYLLTFFSIHLKNIYVDDNSVKKKRSKIGSFDDYNFC